MPVNLSDTCRVGPLDVIGRDGVLLTVRARLTGRTRVLSVSALERLLGCHSFQPLAVHARERLCPENSDAEMLEGLVREQFLIGRADLMRRLRPGRAPADRVPAPRPIETVVVATTGQRPEVARCVESYAANLARFGRSAALLVSEDAEAGTSRATGTRLHDIGKRHGIALRHVTRQERTRFARTIAKEVGASEKTVAFALLGECESVATTTSKLGANRNFVLLATIGQRILSVDDDTVCQLTTRDPQAGSSAGYAFDSRLDPRRHDFFSHRREALAAGVRSELDLLACHEALLGRTIEAVAEAWPPSDTWFNHANGSIIEDIWNGRGKVLLTSMGVAGQSGVKLPLRLLQMEPSWAGQLLPSEALYDATVRSHEVTAVVPCVTLSNRSLFSSMFFGLDNSERIPPFLPILRSQDLLFSKTMRYCSGDAYIAHLPLMLTHDPADGRSRPPDTIWRHTGIELAYLLADFIDSLRDTTPRDGPARITRLGGHLSELASLPLAGVIQTLGELTRQRHRNRVSLLERRRTALSGATLWHKDVDRHLVELSRLLAADDLPPPFDLGLAGADGWRLAHEMIRCWGEMLGVWPLMLEGAARLAARGDGLSGAVGEHP
jgi:hypothetical protein